MLNMSVKRMLLKVLDKTKYNVKDITVTDKYNNLMMSELRYHKSRIFSHVYSERTDYKQLMYVVYDDELLEYDREKIINIFKRSHLYAYGVNTENRKVYKLTYGNEAAIYMLAVTSLLWDKLGCYWMPSICIASLIMKIVGDKMHFHSLKNTVDDYSYILSYTLKKRQLREKNRQLHEENRRIQGENRRIQGENRRIQE